MSAALEPGTSSAAEAQEMGANENKHKKKEALDLN